MTRAQQTISLGLLVSSLYLALYLQLIPLPSLIQQHIVPVVRLCPSPSPRASQFRPQLNVCNPQLPFWALVSFGALLLFRLGWGIMTFNNVPEAHRELMQEIDMAKADLRTMGVDVD
ncbi:dolichol phosphate mannosyltransferase subunit 3 [Metarhizium album ARSEF 1941]|uniref:Dolichol-phosphate mannosyltransferase subunit 3 n=1 Tax=Metarhizium album (strain ARSEF 1941) TaxID=1081103 RepID=A0A0B2X5G4_METAS|nr:dolichol phosphate mannosyltransferase subunit 3 [Metarhizium album ARSEF 1941]KHO01624.1 dolichol phosphate mannosyltransferase subunit 3 [Metarhizium album ARSEF 1941]